MGALLRGSAWICCTEREKKLLPSTAIIYWSVYNLVCTWSLVLRQDSLLIWWWLIWSLLLKSDYVVTVFCCRWTGTVIVFYLTRNPVHYVDKCYLFIYWAREMNVAVCLGWLACIIPRAARAWLRVCGCLARVHSVCHLKQMRLFCSRLPWKNLPKFACLS